VIGDFKVKFEELIHFFFIPIAIGLIGGASAYVFRIVVKFFTTIFDAVFIFHSSYFVFITMPLIFYLSNFLISHHLISSSNVTLDNIAKKISLMSGKFSHIKGFLVLLLSSFSIGFGVPIGREGPIAKLGGLSTEVFTKLIKTPRINLPIYLSAGISAAIAATFNAPIAGIILGIEIIIGRINSYIIIPLIVACTTATLVSREFIGDFTAFYVPHLSYENIYLVFVPVEALLLGAITVVITLSLRKFRILRVKYRKRWNLVVIVLGFLVGLTIFLVPKSAGVGYNYINDIFQYNFNSAVALKIMIAKIIGIIFSIGSGIFGGMMSPSIFIGAFGGYWFGSEAVAYGVDPRVFALAGSAAVLSGISKAPLRSSIIITELTHSYQLLVPILIASSISGYIASKFEPGSYFKRSLLQRGIDIESSVINRYLQKRNLNKFIDNISPISSNENIRVVLKIFKRLHIRYLPVVDDDKLIGVVSLRDVRKRYILRQKNIKVKDIMSERPFAIEKEHTTDDIFKAIAVLNVHYVPYVDKQGKYIGMIDLDKLIKDLSISIQNYRIN